MKRISEHNPRSLLRGERANMKKLSLPFEASPRLAAGFFKKILIANRGEIARRVIHREVQVDRSSVVGIVRACIDRINGAEIHRLRVNPADADMVSRYFQQSDDTDIEIVPDQSVAPGGAILHTSHGQLDARLESQLQEIEYGLIDR